MSYKEGYKDLLVIYILEILSKYTSEEKRISQTDLKGYLKDEYGLDIKSRTTLRKYLSYLEDDGHINIDRDNNKKEIYIVQDLTEAEQRILIDSILYAQYIPKEKADTIIKKLKELYPVGLKDKVRNTIYVQALNRTQNDNLYRVLDNIDEAIETNKKIEITICRYKEDGELHDVWTEIIDPYHIVTSNSRYYVICHGRRGKLESRRIDRISNVEITHEKRKSIKEVTGENDTLDLAKYMKEHIYMYSGESAPIKIKMRKEHIGYLLLPSSHRTAHTAK